VTGEATVGRSTLAAIEVDKDAPEISYGLAPLGRRTIAEIEMSEVPKGDPRSSAPVVRVELASMPAIDAAAEPLGRQTLPFTQTAEELKRGFDAAQKNLAAAASSTIKTSPQRTVFLGHSKPRDPSIPKIIVEEVSIEIDGDAPDPPIAPEPAAASKVAKPEPDAEITIEMQALSGTERDTIQDDDPPGRDPESVITESGERPKRNPRDSGIEDWHKALSEIDRPPRPKVGKGATGFAVGAKKKSKR
jgi:hypothetical protein